MSQLYQDLNLTIFPEGVDNFPQWLDITAQDGPLIKQYMESVNNGNFALANQILSQIPSATQKIIKANDLNKLTQSMLAVERFYLSDVKDYIVEKQSEWENIVNQFQYKGPWSSNGYYVENNMVSYNIFGIEYIFLAIKNPPFGVVPTDGLYWRILTIQGEQGKSGEGLTYREQWKVSTQYEANDAVTYNGALWMALRRSQGVEPTKESVVWRLVMSLATTTYPIQDIQPSNQVEGDLWFNTQGNPTKYYFLPSLQLPATSSDIANGKEAYDEFGNLIVGTRL